MHNIVLHTANYLADKTFNLVIKSGTMQTTKSAHYAVNHVHIIITTIISWCAGL